MAVNEREMFRSTPVGLVIGSALFVSGLIRAQSGDEIKRQSESPQILASTDATDLSFRWQPALLESFLAATLANGERFATEKGTRDAFKGPFFKNYLQDIENFHGWQDGDGILTSYIAHPMEGSFAAFVERQNDPRYKSVEFGTSQRYWTSALRSLAFSSAYSVAWSFGPYGEASLGNVDLHAPPGLVDLVGTQTMGFGWMIGEDMLDRYVIKRIEHRYKNVVIRSLARSMLNPTRSYANLLRFKQPWWRDSRADVNIYVADTNYTPRDDIVGPPFNHSAFPAHLAFELNAQPMFSKYFGKPGRSCMGASGEGVLRMTASSAMVIHVDGCQLFGFAPNYSGDALTYAAGPRFTLASSGPWKFEVQALAGGAKVSHEYADVRLRDELIRIARQNHQPDPEQITWVTQSDTNGFTALASAVASYKWDNGVQLRLADFGYQHSWMPDLDGSRYNSNVRFSFGISYQLGPWER